MLRRLTFDLTFLVHALSHEADQGFSQVNAPVQPYQLV